MSVLTSAVITRVQRLMDDASDAKWTATEKLEAVNAAISDAWPAIKANAIDSSITLTVNTYEYTPSATPEVEGGFSIAYVSTPSSQPKMLLRRVQQRQSGTTWTILVSPDETAGLIGQTLYLHYEARVAQVTASTDPIELPLDYLWKMTAYYLCLFALTKSAHFESRPYQELVQRYQQLAEQSRLSHQRGHLPHLIAIVNDGGRQTPSGRYGENIIAHP